MQFAVFALSSIPDTPTTRRMFGLDDLDDKAVSKVLFHRRKQQTGSSEVLRWDQRAIASLTLIRHSAEGIRLESLDGRKQSEETLLDTFLRAVSGGDRLVTWNGDDTDLPLIRFRCLKYARGLPGHWRTGADAKEVHTDIARWLSASGTDQPTLNDIARKLGFPGMLNHSEQALMDAWVTGSADEARAFSDIKALNTYLLALRLFAVTGEIKRQESAVAVKQLKELLAGDAPGHLSEFVSAWESP